MRRKGNESKPGVTHNTPDKQTPSWRSKTAKKLAAAGLAVAATLSLTACELPGAKNPNPPATAEAVPGGEEAGANEEPAEERSRGDRETEHDGINQITKGFALEIMDKIMTQKNLATNKDGGALAYVSESGGMSASYAGGDVMVLVVSSAKDGGSLAVQINFAGPEEGRVVSDMNGIIEHIKNPGTSFKRLGFGGDNVSGAQFVITGDQILYGGDDGSGEIKPDKAVGKIGEILAQFSS